MKIIFAEYDKEGVYVYQAFSKETVEYAVINQKFGKGFGLDRITWIKPSLGWTLHRTKNATKSGMEAIARIKIKREAWDEIIENTVETKYDNNVFTSKYEWKLSLKKSDAIHQWDPDRNLQGIKILRPAIQIGIRGEFIKKYVNNWTISIEDITSKIQFLKENEDLYKLEEYDLSEKAKKLLGNK